MEKYNGVRDNREFSKEKLSKDFMCLLTKKESIKLLQKCRITVKDRDQNKNKK